MIKCIIIDDNKSDRKIVETTVSQIKHLNLVKTFGSLSEAKDLLEKESIDIVFLQLPGKNGMDILDDMRQKPKIIATSHSTDEAHKAFDIEAVDFILKPITVPRLVKALARAIKIKGQDDKELARDNKSIFIKVKKQFIKLSLKEIYLIEALADYVNIYTTAKRYTIHSTMKAMLEELPEEEFIRVHKSYIVRVDRIAELKDEKLMIEGKTVPVGNSYKKDLMTKLDIL